jgi:metallo-beta-lactamase family protein
MLPDSGHIQEREAEWKGRRQLRAGKRDISPLYTEADALAVLPRLSPVRYGETVEPAPDVRASFLDAGHILGSAILNVSVRDGGRERTLVFTGDLGHRGLPIVRDPSPVERADVVVMESTYGNRVHKGMEETTEEFVHAVTDTLSRKGGNVVIPAFAVGRTQDILYLLADLTRQGRVKGLTVYIDSPLAAEATRITLRHPECFDAETREVYEWREKNPEALRVIVTRGVKDSMALNSMRGGGIILAGSGMCEAGDPWAEDRGRGQAGADFRGGDLRRRRHLHDRRAVRPRRPGRPARLGGGFPDPPRQGIRGSRGGVGVRRVCRSVARAVRLERLCPLPGPADRCLSHRGERARGCP